MTNGVVSIVNGGKVVLKIVCGCDGYNAAKLADALRDWIGDWQGDGCPIDLEDARGVAREVGFGCDDCLVLMNENEFRFDGDDDEIGPLYREKFADPRFNPRWELGVCGHVELVELT